MTLRYLYMSLFFIWLKFELKKNWNKCVRLWYKDEFYNIFISIIISNIYNDEFSVIFWPLERPGLPPRSVCWRTPHLLDGAGTSERWAVNSEQSSAEPLHSWSLSRHSKLDWYEETTGRLTDNCVRTYRSK